MVKRSISSFRGRVGKVSGPSLEVEVQRGTESLQCTSSKVRVIISQLSRVGITLILRILVALLCVNSLQDNILYGAE